MAPTEIQTYGMRREMIVLHGVRDPPGERGRRTVRAYRKVCCGPPAGCRGGIHGRVRPRPPGARKMTPNPSRQEVRSHQLAFAAGGFGELHRRCSCCKLANAAGDGQARHRRAAAGGPGPAREDPLGYLNIALSWPQAVCVTGVLVEPRFTRTTKSAKSPPEPDEDSHANHVHPARAPVPL